MYDFILFLKNKIRDIFELEYIMCSVFTFCSVYLCLCWNYVFEEEQQSSSCKAKSNSNNWFRMGLSSAGLRCKVYDLHVLKKVFIHLNFVKPNLSQIIW